MSNSLAVHDLIANNDEASPMEDLSYLDPVKEIEWFDRIEFHMGMRRGGLERNVPGEKILK
ncbi:hypothetical protein H0H92_007603, partial [Tricholoma furcatifolium]